MTDAMTDPRAKHPADGFPAQEQDQPGLTESTEPTPDHGEDSYVGHERLVGRRALITGGDSGIGRAVAIAFAREGADVAIAHLPEETTDAEHTVAVIEEAGRHGLSLAGDCAKRTSPHPSWTTPSPRSAGSTSSCSTRPIRRTGTVSSHWRRTSSTASSRPTCTGSLFTARAAVPHLQPGASIIVTSSIQAFNPSPGLIDYAMTKAAQVAFVKALAEELGPEGHPGERRGTRARSGRRSSRRPGGTANASRRSAKTRRSDAPGSRPSLPARTCTWLPRTPRTSREPFCRSPEGRVCDPCIMIRRGMRAALAVIGCVVVVLLTACAPLPRDPDGTLDRITGGELHVGASPSEGLVDISGESVSGPLVDIVEGFAEEHDARAVWTVGSEEDLVRDIEGGSLDMAIGGMTDQTLWVPRVGVTRGYPGPGPAIDTGRDVRATRRERLPRRARVLPRPRGLEMKTLGAPTCRRNSRTRSARRSGGSGSRSATPS